jgi:hypothetical protein
MMEVFSDSVVAWRLPTRGKKADFSQKSIGQIINIPFPICGRNSPDQIPAPLEISVWFLIGRKPWNIELLRRVNFAAVRDGAFV